MGGMAAREARDDVNTSAQDTPDIPVEPRAVHILVEGVVQGVGFRPFVYRLANSLNLTGWVRNTSRNVTISIGGATSAIDAFVNRLAAEAPPLARIHSVTVTGAPYHEASGFHILESLVEPGFGQMVSPDVATCPACLIEVLDKSNRRHNYPFTNCTNCGPRFTIITAMPYDRPNTTMSPFNMCPDCLAEYTNPADRRFHAQPNACPVCGPSLSLIDANGAVIQRADPVPAAASLLLQGNIIAIKGLGGYLLACDATSAPAVMRLRQRKHRPSKPFAVMVRDIEAARAHCFLTTEEEALLLSPAAPIVLARWKEGSSICAETAPALLFLGVMVPYTPLHHLLLRECNRPLIMTSGNLSEEPIVADDEEALSRLGGIADYFLTHNRPIHSRYDDSVTMVVHGQVHMLRRARGYAPYPITLTHTSAPVLAVGPQTKNTFCLAEGRRAFVSQHIGDLDSAEAVDHLESTIALYRELFHIEPAIVAHDLHPDYASTSLARRLAPSPRMLRGVQHHHAHVVSCMAENEVEDPVIGVAFDGSGLGPDGHIWGGEFLTCDFNSFRRLGHIEYLPLPGGDAATLRPCRTAAAYIISLLGEAALSRTHLVREALSADELRVLAHQVRSGFNTPLTSSMGRLFDAVAAIVGLRQAIDYDGQAAIELEMQAHRGAGCEEDRYAFGIESDADGFVVRVAPVLDAVLRDMAAGEAVPRIAAAFHHAVIQMTVSMCRRIAHDTALRTVALSGGVFQNRLLIDMLPVRLRDAGFRVLLHRYLPANDGCISLGQAVIADKLR